MNYSTVPKQKILAHSLPSEEIALMEIRNPYNIQTQNQQWLFWNHVYAFGWTSNKFYLANKLRPALQKRGYNDDEIKELFEEVFKVEEQ